MLFASAVKLLSARKRNAYQITVVPVRIKRVTFEMRFNRFNTRICMLT